MRRRVGAGHAAAAQEGRERSASDRLGNPTSRCIRAGISMMKLSRLPRIFFFVTVALLALLLFAKKGASFIKKQQRTPTTSSTSEESMRLGKLPPPDRKEDTLNKLHRHLFSVKEAAEEDTVFTINMDVLSEPIVFRSRFISPLNASTLAALPPFPIPNLKLSSRSNIFSYTLPSNKVWSSQGLGPYHSYTLIKSLDSSNFSWFFSDFDTAAPPFRYGAIRQQSSIAWERLHKQIQAAGVLEAVCGSGDCSMMAFDEGGSASSNPLPSLSPSSPISSRPEKGDDSVVQERIWLHSAGATAQLHIDYQHNLFAQVVGRKRFVIIAPSLMPFCCLYPYNHPAKRQSALNVADSLNLTHAFIFHHHARDDQIQKTLLIEDPGSVRPSCPLIDIAQLRRQLEGRRGEGGLIWEVILHPGDILALPAGFGHYVESLDGTLSYNVWIDDKSRESVAQAFSLLSQAAIVALKIGPRRAVDLTLAIVRMWLTTIWGGEASTPTSSSSSSSSSFSLLSSSHIANIITQGYRQRYHPHLFAEVNGNQKEGSASNGGLSGMPQPMSCAGVLNEDFESKVLGYVSDSARLMTQGFHLHSVLHLETLNILDRMLLLLCKLKRLQCDDVETLASLYLSFLPCDNN